jgi:carboxypeptidase Taq
MKDVTEEEFYAALNMVRPSLIRTEADEFTYTFHIIIRYEIEKALFSGQAKVEEIRELWNRKYEQYLGIRPSTDRQGVLQDVHWTSGFGYFPTYAIGNFYNAMYYNRMKEEIPVEASISAGNFEPVNRWMAEHVFAKSDLLAPQEWIRDITGRSFTPDDFLDYLEEKYSGIYLL